MIAPDAPDPYETYALLATQPGLHRIPDRPGWWLAAHPDATSALLESDACAVRPAAEPVPFGLVGTAAGAVFARLVRMRDDEPRNAMKAEIVRALASVPEAELTRIARAAASRVDLPLRVLFDLTPYVLAELLGVPANEHREVARAAACFARALAPGAVVTDHEALEHAVLDLERAVSCVRDARLAHVDVANRVGLFFQGFDATAGLIGNAVLAIGRDRALSPRAAVEWAAQHDPSIHTTRRFVRHDVTLAGERLRRGDSVLLLLAADAATFAFGQGRHACPARAFATTVACAGVEALQEHGRWTTTGYHASSNARIPRLSRTLDGEGAGS